MKKFTYQTLFSNLNRYLPRSFKLSVYSAVDTAKSGTSIDIEISITMGTSQLNNELEDSIVKPDTGPDIAFSDSDIW